MCRVYSTCRREIDPSFQISPVVGYFTCSTRLQIGTTAGIHILQGSKDPMRRRRSDGLLELIFFTDGRFQENTMTTQVVFARGTSSKVTRIKTQINALPNAPNMKSKTKQDDEGNVIRESTLDQSTVLFPARDVRVPARPASPSGDRIRKGEVGRVGRGGRGGGGKSTRFRLRAKAALHISKTGCSRTMC